MSSTAGLTERERLIFAVTKIETGRTGEIVDLLQGVSSESSHDLVRILIWSSQLEKKQRALCLFNPTYLESKIAEALEVLDSLEDDPIPSAPSILLSPSDQSRTEIPSTTSPLFPEASLRPTTITTLPTSIVALAQLPAIDIIDLINTVSASHSLDSLGITRIAPAVEQAMNQFFDSLQNSPIQLVKQSLGEKLFKEIKSFGIKGAVGHSFPCFARRNANSMRR